MGGSDWRGSGRYTIIHVSILTLLFVVATLARAQTSRPADSSGATTDGSVSAGPTGEVSKPTRKPYDPFKSKEMTGDWGGVRTDLADLGLRFELSYQQQFQQNFRGGLDTHNAHEFSGSYDLVGKLDFGKMKLIENAGFYFKAKGNYSDGVNPEFVGASSAANPNSDVGGDQPVYVKKWWYWQKFLDDKIELRLGIIETNKDIYDVSPYANHEDKDFLNRLSIRNATIPHRTGMGAFLQVTPTDWMYAQAGAFDAQSRERRTGFDTAFHDEDWYVGLWEFGLTPKWKTAKGPMPGCYRAGFWYDPRSKTVFEDTLDGARKPSHRGGDVGLYLGFDQMVFKENDDPKDAQGLGLYARYGHAHRDVNRISDYWSAGLSYKGLLPTRDTDTAAFGVAQAIYSELYRNEVNDRADRETVYEWIYICNVTPWCIITPNLQVITNPGGDKDDRDSIVGGVRIRIIF